MKIVVGITGASGVIYGIRLLERLREAGVETHLVMSEWAEKGLAYETDYRPDQVKALAHFCYRPDDLAAVLSSGSFRHQGMAVAPCSMKTLSAISSGYADNLVARAADVCLKERRRLILLARETPLNAIHLQNMLTLTQAGALLMPPVPAFYSRPETIGDIVDHTVGRVMDHLGVEHSFIRRWEGPGNR